MQHIAHCSLLGGPASDSSRSGYGPSAKKVHEPSGCKQDGHFLTRRTKPTRPRTALLKSVLSRSWHRVHVVGTTNVSGNELPPSSDHIHLHTTTLTYVNMLYCRRLSTFRKTLKMAEPIHHFTRRH